MMLPSRIIVSHFVRRSVAPILTVVAQLILIRHGAQTLMSNVRYPDGPDCKTMDFRSMIDFLPKRLIELLDIIRNCGFDSCACKYFWKPIGMGPNDGNGIRRKWSRCHRRVLFYM